MNRLRDLREDKDLSQIELSNLLNCSQSTYSRYENENLNIPVDVLKILAKFYNVSVDYLLGLTDKKN